MALPIPEKIPYGIDLSSLERFLGHAPPHDLGGGVTMLAFRVQIIKLVARETALDVSIVAADRDNGSAIPITFTVNDDRLREASGDARRKLIKSLLLQCIDHDLDELLLLGGERDDPHRPAIVVRTYIE